MGRSSGLLDFHCPGRDLLLRSGYGGGSTSNEGQLYEFPRSNNGAMQYGNIEGVGWITSTRVVTVSNRRKKSISRTKHFRKKINRSTFLKFPRSAATLRHLRARYTVAAAMAVEVAVTVAAAAAASALGWAAAVAEAAVAIMEEAIGAGLTACGPGALTATATSF